MKLRDLIALLARSGAANVYAKPLSENDNSKQQIYLGPNFDVLSVLPFGEVVADTAPSEPNFKAPMALYWLGNEGQLELAAGAQLILYPQYPEVRLSGFLQGTTIAPSAHLRPVPADQRKRNNEPDGRVLFFGVTPDDRVICYLTKFGDPISIEFLGLSPRLERLGVLFRIGEEDSKTKLIGLLSKICKSGWCESQRMLPDGSIIPYSAPNGGGYTLEALLGIAPNGLPLPDYLDWEIKAHSSGRITLMTPEPDGGIYGTLGLREFLSRYRTSENNGKRYFTGIHVYGIRHSSSLMLADLHGFDPQSGKITDVKGGINLWDSAGILAASWSFAKLIEHWSNKHSSAAYVHFESSLGPHRLYRYLSPVRLGVGTHFDRFLAGFSAGLIVYDPAPKSWLVNGKTLAKGRSQFRTSVQQLGTLYDSFELVDLGQQPLS